MKKLLGSFLLLVFYGFDNNTSLSTARPWMILQFSCNDFIHLDLSFRSLIHLELSFVYSERKGLSFVLLHMRMHFGQHYLLNKLWEPVDFWVSVRLWGVNQKKSQSKTGIRGRLVFTNPRLQFYFVLEYFCCLGEV